MFSSLWKLSAGLSTDPAFQGYCDAKALMTIVDELAHLDKVEQDFFLIAERSLVKHSSQWLSQNFLPCAIATPEQEISEAFASYFFGAADMENCTFYSHVHNTEISTAELIDFVQFYAYFCRETSSSLSLHMEAVKEIASGKKLYDLEGSEINKEFQFFVSYTYLPLPSHTQFVESSVKESAIVSETGREERSHSMLVIVRSHTVEPFLQDARNNMVHKEENRDKKMHPKGWKRTRSILAGIKTQHYKINVLIEAGGNLNPSTVSLSVPTQYKKKR